MESSSQKPRLLDKVALITGGAQGIGEKIARLFVSHGAKVVIADIQDDLGETICKELGQDEDDALYIHCDVTKETDVKNAVDTVIDKYGRLDIMFNNAGITGEYCVKIVNCTSEEFKKVFDINVYGSFLGAKHAARVMIPAKEGVIIFNSSVASVIAAGIPYAYAMSKHAVVGMSRSLCAELGQYGIRVNCVSPYGVSTPMVTSLLNIKEESIEGFFKSAANLKGVDLKAEDVAEVVLYLASDEAKYVSWLNLVVDGGYSNVNTSYPLAVKAAIDNGMI